MNIGPNLISYPFQTSQSIEEAVGNVAGNIYGFIGEGIAEKSLLALVCRKRAGFKCGVGIAVCKSSLAIA